MRRLPRVPEGPEPLFERIAQSLAKDITSGALGPGERLWGSRTLSDALGVSRATVEAAYDALHGKGLVDRRGGSGSFVAQHERVLRGGGSPGFAFELPPQPARQALAGNNLLLSGGLDPALLPLREVARALRRTLSQRGRLKRSGPLGSERLRAVVAHHLRVDRGLHVQADEVMIAPTAPEAARWVLRAVLGAEGVVAASVLEHQAFNGVLRAMGAHRSVTVDREANDAPVALEGGRRIAARWIQPHSHHPTTDSLPPRVRTGLLEWAQRHSVAVLEADYSHWLTLDGMPPDALAATDAHRHVVYLGTLTHLLAPDVELSWIVAPAPFLEAVARWRMLDGWGQDTLATEAAVAELIEDGILRRSLRRLRSELEARRDALAAAVTARLGSTVAFDLPTAGTGLWLRLDPSIDIEGWAARALRLGVLVRTARYFALDGRVRPFMRLGFSAQNPDMLREGVVRLARAFHFTA